MKDQDLVDGVVAIVKAATAPLAEEIKALRAEVAALKAVQPAPAPGESAEALAARVRQALAARD